MSGAFDLTPEERQAAVDALARMPTQDRIAVQWAIRCLHGEASPLLLICDDARSKVERARARLAETAALSDTLN